MSKTRPIHVGPDMRVVHPDHGDITEDVAREMAILNAETVQREAAEAQQRQEHIAKTCGRESKIHKRGGLRLVAQIDETVFNYWEAREGRDFWKHELKYMCKRHPELAVRALSQNPTIVNPGLPTPAPTRSGVRGKRGRWAA